jgi:hypothetical protein
LVVADVPVESAFLHILLLVTQRYAGGVD